MEANQLLSSNSNRLISNLLLHMINRAWQEIWEDLLPHSSNLFSRNSRLMVHPRLNSNRRTPDMAEMPPALFRPAIPRLTLLKLNSSSNNSGELLRQRQWPRRLNLVMGSRNHLNNSRRNRWTIPIHLQWSQRRNHKGLSGDCLNQPSSNLLLVLLVVLLLVTLLIRWQLLQRIPGRTRILVELHLYLHLLHILSPQQPLKRSLSNLHMISNCNNMISSTISSHQPSMISLLRQHLLQLQSLSSSFK